MCDKKVIGQSLNKEVKELILDVQTIFPKKQLHIAKLEDAAKELANLDMVQPKTDCLAFTLPAITECIAIWIRADLLNEEFNAVLAEELFHHKQAYEGFPEITCLRPLRPEINYQRNFSEIHTFGLEICSIICDLDAHRRMEAIQINIEPLLATDLRNLRDSIKVLNSSEAKLKALKAGVAKVSFFPKYLLFWFDLYELGFSTYVSTWQNEIRPWLVNVMPDTLRLWDELTTFIHSNPIIDAESAKQAIIFVFEKLLSGIPTLEPKKTFGISCPSLCQSLSSPNLHNSKELP
jgi:hypothetical protein